MGQEAPNSTRIGGRAKVLVVDDARLVRVMISSILQRAGYDTDQAPDGAAALALLARGVYDVVITDLKMPGMDGFAVLAGVKRACPNVEVIILTGTHAKDVNCAIRALRLGAHDYLSKPPSNAEEVIVAVERALEKKLLKDANQKLLRELEILSRKDALTGALNRRCFNETLGQEVARARRHGHDLSMVLLDIYQFKRINDTHGHPGGDTVLCAFTQTIRETLREGDTLYRYGGEEFAVLLPHTASDGALTAAQRIVSAVARATMAIDGKPVRITTSAGVACLGRSTRSGEDLVAGADKALYEAKEGGRNRAVLQGCPLALVGGRRGA